MDARLSALFLAAMAAMTPLAAQQLLILHKGGSSLGYYTPQGKLLGTVPTGQHPHEMVLSRDGRLLYTTDNGTMLIEQAGTGGNTVSIIDVAAKKRIGQISLGDFHRPHGIDLDPATGHLAVSCELPDQLLIVDPVARKVIRRYATQGKTAHMVRFGPGAKFAYVSNSTSSNVSAINLATGAVTLIPTKERPEGSVLSPDGRFLYVVNRNQRAVAIIDTTKQALAGEIPAGDGPVRVEMTPDGSRLVWALLNGHKLEIADPASRRVLAQIDIGGQAQLVSLSVSRDGKLAYTSAQDADTVYVVSLVEKRIVREIHTQKGMGPDPVIDLP